MSTNENADLGSGGGQGPPKLKRSMGLSMATALVIGNMVGSGVFLLPASLADAAGPVSIVGWLFTGVGAMLLALVFAGLGRTFPRTGGPYAYARRAFGDFVGFQTASRSSGASSTTTTSLPRSSASG
jgi:amino acid transporter